MAPKKNTKQESESKKEVTVEEPVVETKAKSSKSKKEIKVEEPVVKSGKSSKAKKVESETEPEPVVETKPVKAGKASKAKKVESETEPEPVVETKPVKAGKASKAKKVESEAEPEPVVETKPVKAGKASKSKKVVEEPVVEAKSAKATKSSASKKVVETKSGEDTSETPAKPERKHRSFKAIYSNPKGVVVMEGRYCGAKPKQAACKALTGIHKLYKKNETKLTGPIKFGVRETTRNSKNKLYWYSGDRLTLKEPVTLDLSGGKTIVYKYNSVVKKASEDDCKNLLKYKCVDSDEEEQTGGKKATKKVTKGKTVKAKVVKQTKTTKVVKKTADKPEKSEKAEKKPVAKKVQKK
jgi:hypothetical protein